MNPSFVAVTGNTYPVKDQLKALGARWDPNQKAWMVDPSKADQAQSLVSGASAQAKAGGKPHFAKCHECGAPSHGYYRCYYCSLEYDRYVLGGYFRCKQNIDTYFKKGATAPEREGPRTHE